MYRVATSVLGAAALWSGAAGAADYVTATPRAPGVDPRPYSFFVHAGVGGLWLSEGASLTAGGAPVAGGNISIRPKPQITAVIEFGYFVTPNVAISFTGGFPPSIDINGAGTIAGLGRLGSATYGPMTLTAHYHFTGLGAFQPYVGLGPTFMYVFKTSDAMLANLHIDHAIGFAGQIGFDYMINENWGLFVDLKKAYLRTHATGTLGGAPIRARVKLDPLVLSTGLTYRF